MTKGKPMIRTLILAAAAGLATPAAAQDPVPAAIDYGIADNWLCLPGRADSCATPLATTALNPNGYGSTGQAAPAADPPIDCFYVYPTVSRDAGVNSDLVPGLEERATAMVQFARFAGICRPFAPMYRQVTLAGLQSALAGGAGGDSALAYQDVLAAWRDYLANRNQGRPFVLIGHSQGSIMLSQLLAQEIEGSEAADRMLSALLIGWNVEVPVGKTVGGTFKRTPLCTRVGETGCVVTYMSFRATNPPPPGSLFGRTAAPGMSIGCTNPARLSRTTAPLDSYWYAGPGSSPIDWSAQGSPPTPFLRTEALASAACVTGPGFGYLSVTVNADGSDARTDSIPGDVVVNGSLLPGWGLHLADMNLGQGDLIALVEAQRDAFAAGN